MPHLLQKLVSKTFPLRPSPLYSNASHLIFTRKSKKASSNLESRRAPCLRTAGCSRALAVLVSGPCLCAAWVRLVSFVVQMCRPGQSFPLRSGWPPT